MSVTTLYRFYDNDDRLLYVGISERGPERWRAHRKDKPWWEEVAFGTTEHFESRTDAALAERAAILNERPLYNIAKPKVTDANTGSAAKGDWSFWDDTGRLYTSNLYLHWELALSTEVDYSWDGCIDRAGHLLDWASEVYKHGPWDGYGEGWVPITWYIKALGAKAFEYAPGAPNHPEGEDDFGTRFSTPTHNPGGWLFCPQALPVADYVWTHKRRDPGGYIQAKTGWKPLPYQPAMDCYTLLRAADVL